MYECVCPDDWNESSLFELAHWKNGLAFKNIDFAESGRPVIKIAELKNGVTSQTARTMAEYDPSVSVRRTDMLFSWSGNPDTSIDVFRWEGEEGWLNQHIFKVTPSNGVSQDFLFFLLKWLKPRFAEIARNKQTTGLGHVTIKDLKRMLVGVPDPREQKEIVRIIGPIQEKIDLNRRMNETLEAMARAIFRDWFVDFGPTRAKAEGHAPYLTHEFWNLFPDALDEEGKPIGWSNRSIYEFSDVVYGAPLASKNFNTENIGIPLIRIRDLATHEPGVSTVQTHKKGHMIEPGDIIVGMDGEFRLHIWKGPRAWLNQRVCHFEPKIGVPHSYLAEALKEPLAFFERSKVGTTVIHLGKSDIDTFELVYPGERVLNAFAKIAEPLVEGTVSNALQVRTLAQTRDLLLPKLMSGEIRLTEAEKAVEAVT